MIPNGLLWNEAEIERGHSLNHGLLSLCIIKDHESINLIGTAFIIQSNGNNAIALSAAHCFEGIRRLLNPYSTHHSSTPNEFLPPSKEIDISCVKALYILHDAVFVCSIELSIWDSETDFAALKIIAPDDQDIFRDMCLLDNSTPEVGKKISMIGFGEMSSQNSKSNFGEFIVRRRLIVRIGFIEELFMHGYYLLKAPCVKTSIAIFPGMSGGIVAHGWPEPGAQIKPFALISHSMSTQDTNLVNDRSISGHAMGALINAAIEPISSQSQKVLINVNNIGLGRIPSAAPPCTAT